VTINLAVGGCERHLSTILPKLKDYWDIRVLVWGPELGYFAQGLQDHGIAVLPLLQHPYWEQVPSYASYAKHAARTWRLNRWLDHGITHFFLSAPYILGMLSSWWKTGPFIMSRRSLNAYQTQGIAALERILHKRLTFAVGNSERVVQQLRDEGIPESKLRLIYNGMEPERFYCPEQRDLTRHALGISPETVVMIHIANLFPYKGHEDLLQAIARLPPELPFCLLSVGRDHHGLQATLASLAQTLGIAKRIFWLGPRHDIPLLLAAADISILCSHQEGFSNVILESMSASLPLVVTDVGGNAEAVKHEITGLVVPPHAPNALSLALKGLLTCPAQRQEFGQRGAHRIATHFSLSTCLTQYQNLYEAAYSKNYKKHMY